MTKGTKILVVNSQPRARASLRALLATWSATGEIQETSTGLQALEKLEYFHPDVILLDVVLPDVDGLDAARIIKKHEPGIKVVVISLYPDMDAGARAAGADAFVSKGEPPEKLLETLAAVTGLAV